MYIMLIDKSGNILIQKTYLENFTIEANVDFEILKNGRVVWPYVDPDSKKLQLYMTPVPE